MIKERINEILHSLNENLFEREEAIKLALLSTLAGESIFLLGQPGVAKSLIARRIKEIFKDGDSFEYLMNRFSTPDEIFGPIAISKLKKEDKYERITEKYLPSADIVFLDEIWKAGPSIQNSLLTVINEKIYRNGQQEIKIPLKGLISASNELPSKGEGLEALWDRFIIRYLVENITNPEKFNTFLTTENIGFDIIIDDKLKISNTEYSKWQTNISKVKISDEAINVINVVRSYIVDYNIKKTTKNLIYVSDRRWKKIVKILKTSAFLNARKEIDLMDCFLITHTIWNEVEDIKIVREFVTDAIEKHGYSLKYNLSMFSDEIGHLELDIKNHLKKRIEVIYSPKELIHKTVIYYEIIDNGNLPISKNNGSSYETNYIKKDDFKKLYKSKFSNTNLFDKDFDNAGKYEVKVISYNEIAIRDESSLITKYKIQATSSKEETETIRPHIAIIKDWDKKVLNISKSIDKTVKEIEAFKNKDLAGLKENLFVSKKLAPIVEKNINQTLSSFLSEKIKVEKLKAGYDKL